MITAELLMTVGGITAFILTVNWVRKRQLREKYAIGWITVALILLIFGLFPSLVMSFADTAMQPAVGPPSRSARWKKTALPNPEMRGRSLWPSMTTTS